MTQVVEIAMKKLESLEGEAARLREFIVTYRELANQGGEVFSESSNAHSAIVVDADAAESVKATPSEVVEAADRLIRERKRPMTRTELVNAMEEHGMVIGGTDKSKNMGTIIWRSERFTNIEGYGYWPVDLTEWSPVQSNERPGFSEILGD